MNSGNPDGPGPGGHLGGARPAVQSYHGQPNGQPVLRGPEQENVLGQCLTGVGRFFREGQELKPEELPMQVAAAQDIDLRDSEVGRGCLPSGKWRNILGLASPLHDADGRVAPPCSPCVYGHTAPQAGDHLRERMKELACLYAVSRGRCWDCELSLDELCRVAVPEHLFLPTVPGAYRGWMELNGKRFTSGNYEEELFARSPGPIRVDGQGPRAPAGSIIAQERPLTILVSRAEQNLVNGVVADLTARLERPQRPRRKRKIEQRYRRLFGGNPPTVSIHHVGTSWTISISTSDVRMMGYLLEERNDISMGAAEFYADPEFRDELSPAVAHSDGMSRPGRRPATQGRVRPVCVCGPVGLPGRADGGSPTSKTGGRHAPRASTPKSAAAE